MKFGELNRLTGTFSTVEAFGVIAGSGWAAGIKLYLVTLLLGIAGRLGWSDIPEVLIAILVVATTMITITFVEGESRARRRVGDWLGTKPAAAR